MMEESGASEKSGLVKLRRSQSLRPRRETELERLQDNALMWKLGVEVLVMHGQSQARLAA